MSKHTDDALARIESKLDAPTFSVYMENDMLYIKAKGETYASELNESQYANFKEFLRRIS